MAPSDLSYILQRGAQARRRRDVSWVRAKCILLESFCPNGILVLVSVPFFRLEMGRQWAAVTFAS